MNPVTTCSEKLCSQCTMPRPVGRLSTRASRLARASLSVRRGFKESFAQRPAKDAVPDHTKKRRGTPRRFVTCQTRSASIVPVPVLPTPASVAFHPAVGNPVCVAVRMYTVTLHPDVSSTAPIPVSRRPLPPRPNDWNGLVTWRRRRDPDVHIGRGRGCNARRQ